MSEGDCSNLIKIEGSESWRVWALLRKVNQKDNTPEVLVSICTGFWMQFWNRKHFCFQIFYIWPTWGHLTIIPSSLRVTDRVLYDLHVCLHSPKILPISLSTPKTPNFLLSLIIAGMLLFWASVLVPSGWKAILPSVLRLPPLPPQGFYAEITFTMRLALSTLFKIITPASPPGTHCYYSIAYSFYSFFNFCLTIITIWYAIAFIYLLSCFSH